MESRVIISILEVLQHKCLLHLPSSFAVGYGQMYKFWLLRSKQKCHVAASGKFPYEMTCVKYQLFFNLKALAVDVTNWTIEVMLHRKIRNKEIESFILWTTYPDIYLNGDFKFSFVYATASSCIPCYDSFTQPNLIVSNACGWRRAQEKLHIWIREDTCRFQNYLMNVFLLT